MKAGKVILIAVIFLIIGIFIASWYITSKNVCYELPTEGGPDVWGKFYWKALHNTVERIPCSLCKNEATGFMEFFHDFVNNKTGKKIMFPENYYQWIDKISEIKKQHEG